jgi:hypothetical protein
MSNSDLITKACHAYETLELNSIEDADFINTFVCTVCDIHAFLQSAPKGQLQLNLAKLVHRVVMLHTPCLTAVSIHRILTFSFASRLEDMKEHISVDLLTRLLALCRTCQPDPIPSQRAVDTETPAVPKVPLPIFVFDQLTGNARQRLDTAFTAADYSPTSSNSTTSSTRGTGDPPAPLTLSSIEMSIDNTPLSLLPPPPHFSDAIDLADFASLRNDDVDFSMPDTTAGISSTSSISSLGAGPSIVVPSAPATPAASAVPVVAASTPLTNAAALLPPPPSRSRNPTSSTAAHSRHSTAASTISLAPTPSSTATNTSVVSGATAAAATTSATPKALQPMIASLAFVPDIPSPKPTVTSSAQSTEALPLPLPMLSVASVADTRVFNPSAFVSNMLLDLVDHVVVFNEGEAGVTRFTRLNVHDDELCAELHSMCQTMFASVPEQRFAQGLLLVAKYIAEPLSFRETVNSETVKRKLHSLQVLYQVMALAGPFFAPAVAPASVVTSPEAVARYLQRKQHHIWARLLLRRFLFPCVALAATSPVPAVFQSVTDLVRLWCRHGHHTSSLSAQPPVFASMLKIELGALWSEVWAPMLIHPASPWPIRMALVSTLEAMLMQTCSAHQDDAAPSAGPASDDMDAKRPELPTVRHCLGCGINTRHQVGCTTDASHTVLDWFWNYDNEPDMPPMVQRYVGVHSVQHV